MQLINHGGCCCGIKTIHGFDHYNANAIVPAISASTLCYPADPALHHDHSYPGKNFFKGPAPAEPQPARLDRFLAYVDLHRPSHLIEIVLNGMQKPKYDKILEERSFKQVSEFKNSNSGVMVYVYHRVTPLSKKKKTEGEV